MFVEQAIFTSLKTRRQEGYQLAGVSPGIGSDMAAELEAWGPAHDSLLDARVGGASINFHALQSGDYCVSRTMAAGEEYSGRGGPRVYTQMLIVPPATMLRFANNPFAIIDAAEASGQMPVHDHAPPRLEPVRLVGRASPANLLRLAELTNDPGIDVLVLLLDRALGASPVAAICETSLTRLFAGLFSLLPVATRLQYSLSTGLRYSARRPVRLLAMPADNAEQRSLVRASGAATLDCTDPAKIASHNLGRGWSRLMLELLRSGQSRLIPEVLRRADRSAEQVEELDRLAEELHGQLVVQAA